MIQLGGAAVLCRAAADDPDACAPSERRGQLGLEMGLRLATHCLDRHTASGAGGAFEAGSMWEYIDDEGKPYMDGEGMVISDPGHALEFVGLCGFFLREAARLPEALVSEEQRATMGRLHAALPLLLEVNFRECKPSASPSGLCLSKALCVARQWLYRRGHLQSLRSSVWRAVQHRLAVVVAP